MKAYTWPEGLLELAWDSVGAHGETKARSRRRRALASREQRSMSSAGHTMEARITLPIPSVRAFLPILTAQ
jgi:hypothetical protein